MRIVADRGAIFLSLALTLPRTTANFDVAS